VEGISETELTQKQRQKQRRGLVSFSCAKRSELVTMRRLFCLFVLWLSHLDAYYIWPERRLSRLSARTFSGSSSTNLKKKK
jgi:hypothetical protein